MIVGMLLLAMVVNRRFIILSLAAGLGLAAAMQRVGIETLVDFLMTTDVLGGWASRLVAFAGLFGGALMAAWKAYRTYGARKEVGLQGLALGFLVSLLIMGIHGLTDSVT